MPLRWLDCAIKNLNDRRHKQGCDYYKLSLSLYLYFYLSFSLYQSPNRDKKLSINTNSTGNKFLNVEKTTELYSLNVFSVFLIKKVIDNKANGVVDMCKKSYNEKRGCKNLSIDINF